MPTLEFTLMVGCPLKCTFCPQDAVRKAYGNNTKYLSLQHFQDILGKVPRHVRIDFSGMAEPWANPDATSMLRYALQDGRTVAIYTTLYGMEDEDGAAVIDLLRGHADQIEVLCLHLPDEAGNIRGWRYSPLYERNLRRFIAFGPSGVLGRPRLVIRRFGVLRRLLKVLGLSGVLGRMRKAAGWSGSIGRFELMTMDASGRLHHDLDHLGITLGAWTGHTRAGNVGLDDVRGQKISRAPEKHGAVSCSFTPFYDQNVCLPNGDVVLCCMDYSLKHRIGNLLEQEYYEMFASGAIAPLLSENMNPIFSCASLCKTCDRARVYCAGPEKQFWKTLT